MHVRIPSFSGEILVFEDNETNQHFIKSILIKSGFNVVVANNGKEGVDIVSGRIKNVETPFDLIFMDMYMPVMDGLEAADALIKLGVKAPIIVMTSNVTPQDMETYGAHGLSDFLTKPFSMEDVWNCLYKYFTPSDSKSVSRDRFQESEADRQKRLFSKFVKSNQTTFCDICSAIKSGDIKLAHRLAHTLSGLAGLMGKTALQEVSRGVVNIS